MLKMVAAAAGGAAITFILMRNTSAQKKILELPWTYKKANPIAVAERAYRLITKEVVARVRMKES